MFKRFTLILMSLRKLKFKIDKRKKFFITAGLLAAGLLAIQLTGIEWYYWAIVLLGVATYFLSAWSLSEGLGGVEWLTVLTLPVLFSIGVGLFYFLTPVLWLARLPLIFLYGTGLYALLLTENIFSVAAIRTIQLLRSAHAVSFLLTLVTSFFLYNVILSFREAPWFNFLLIFAISLPIFLQGLWCINLEEKLTLKIWFYSLGAALVLGEIALAFSFWPVTVAVGSLSLTTTLYILLGLIQHHFSERLFRRTINEYIGVGIAILIVIFLTTHWGG